MALFEGWTAASRSEPGKPDSEPPGDSEMMTGLVDTEPGAGLVADSEINSGADGDLRSAATRRLACDLLLSTGITGYYRTSEKLCQHGTVGTLTWVSSLARRGRNPVECDSSSPDASNQIKVLRSSIRDLTFNPGHRFTFTSLNWLPKASSEDPQ